MWRGLGEGHEGFGLKFIGTPHEWTTVSVSGGAAYLRSAGRQISGWRNVMSQLARRAERAVLQTETDGPQLHGHSNSTAVTTKKANRFSLRESVNTSVHSISLYPGCSPH